MTDERPLPRPSRRTMLGAGVAVAALAAAGSVAWLRRDPPSPAAGLAPIPKADWWERSFPTPDGTPLAVRTFKGRPLLLNFWASWCPPCVQEMPLLAEFYRHHHANGWQVLGLAVDRPDAVRRFLARHPMPFPIALAGDEGLDLARALGDAQGSLPFSVLFDASGAIADRHLGQLHPKQLNHWVTTEKS